MAKVRIYDDEIQRRWSAKCRTDGYVPEPPRIRCADLVKVLNSAAEPGPDREYVLVHESGRGSQQVSNAEVLPVRTMSQGGLIVDVQDSFGKCYSRIHGQVAIGGVYFQAFVEHVSDDTMPVGEQRSRQHFRVLRRATIAEVRALWEKSMRLYPLAEGRWYEVHQD